MTPDFAALRATAARAAAEDGPSPLCLAGMTPWLCTYSVNGAPYGIVLYGTDPEQVWNDNADALPGLEIDGVVYATIQGGAPK